MGNWRHRGPRRFYRQDAAPKYPPSYHLPETCFSEFSNDGVPLWEKKFCTIVGKVSWRKIVDTKKLTSPNDNVLNWDDSAGEEAFHNAKSRKRIFSPPDVEEDIMVGEENKIAGNLLSAPTEGCNKSPSKFDNPWENNNVTQDSSKDCVGWGHFVLKVDDLRNLNSDGNNPWESSITQENESGNRNSWGYNGSRDWNTGNNSWGHSYQGLKKDDGWGDYKRTYWGRNQRDTNKMPNRDNSWKHSYAQCNVTPNDNRWGDCGRNCWKVGGNHDVRSRKLDFRSSSSGGPWHSGSRKREGSHQYIPGYKSSRFQPDDNQANYCWRSGQSNKRVSFPRE
ncbi:putative Cysteine-rich receptor-like protein kinase 10 [Hibiscus syriacus]|uniref:Cysteine-rich receptor-like protein kinase 10 n=1 Tax=Hibiscus syriacus TaxID=106335 RepID=A0A6A2ZW41_HIBSY|nr:putative Cysteine-rich receptor-like protein kinase 10 [Hibiscus syriacus]